MKYLEFTFRTVPCTEIVNDVLSGVLGEAGFESFVEQTDGITAYIQKELYNESLLKEALADFPLPDTQIEYNFVEAEDKDWNEEWEKNLSLIHICFTQFYSWGVSKQSPILLDSLNTWLDSFKKGKEYKKIYKRYYGKRN